MIWGAKNIARLLELAATGISYTQIGKILGITKNAAIGKSRRLKIDKSPALPTNIKAKKRVRKPQPKPQPIQPTPPPPSVSVSDMKLFTMMALQEGHCRYPIGSGDEMLFCGKQKNGGKPYCQEHCDICYNPIKPRLRHSVQKF